MKKLIKKFKKLSKKKKLFIIVIIVLLLALGAGFVSGFFDKEIKKRTSDEPTYSQLTGLEVPPEEADKPILGIMVENSPFARPQTGVGSAGMVFESVTEGGITRYLTLFQQNLPEEVGPVRSVRPYFVNWFMGLDASIAHVGGSEEALALISQRDAKTLSQFTYTDPYYRSSERAAPHNMYARTADLSKLQDELEHKKAEFDAIPRGESKPAQNTTATNIQVDYSSPDYAVEFRYDEQTNSYLRFLAGEPDIDAGTNKQISVKNVVVIEMSGSTVDAIGSGTATVFQNGNAKKATWEQDSYENRIKLTDAEGREVPLNRGSTWFAVVPSTGSTSY